MGRGRRAAPVPGEGCAPPSPVGGTPRWGESPIPHPVGQFASAGKGASARAVCRPRGRRARHRVSNSRPRSALCCPSCLGATPCGQIFSAARQDVSQCGGWRRTVGGGASWHAPACPPPLLVLPCSSGTPGGRVPQTAVLWPQWAPRAPPDAPPGGPAPAGAATVGFRLPSSANFSALLCQLITCFALFQNFPSLSKYST